MSDKNLLIVFHSQSGRNEQLALACYQAVVDTDTVNCSMKRATDAEARHVIDADALLLIGPENSGLLSGGIKDFLDRVFYPLERAGKQGLPYALIIGCGNDGSNCERQTDKILKGIQARKIQPTEFVYGPPDDDAIARCCELAAGIAEGLDMGVF